MNGEYATENNANSLASFSSSQSEPLSQSPHLHEHDSQLSRPHGWHPQQQQQNEEQEETEAKCKSKNRRSFSNENMLSSSNKSASMSHANGSSSNWRFSRKRSSFQDLSSLHNLERSSSSGGNGNAAPSTKILRGNGSSSFGLRRRYSFESFELKKGSSSGSESGVWPEGGRRGGPFPYHHQYSSLPLPLSKRLSCRVLPTSTTLEPIPPSPTAPEDEEENNRDNSNPSDITSNNNNTHASGDNPSIEEKEKANLSVETEKLKPADFDGPSKADTNIIPTTTTTFDKIKSSPGETLNFLLDELFYELILLVNCLRRGSGWLVIVTHSWFSTQFCSPRDDTKVEKISALRLLPSFVSSFTLSKLSLYSSSLLSSWSSALSSGAASTASLFKLVCTRFHGLGNSARSWYSLQLSKYQHNQLCNKILVKIWRQKEVVLVAAAAAAPSIDDDCVKRSANDDEQPKNDGKDQMTNYATGDDGDESNDETDKKVSDARKKEYLRNINGKTTTGGGIGVTSKLSLLRENFVKSCVIIGGRNCNRIVFCLMTLMALLLLILMMMLLLFSPMSPEQIPSSSSSSQVLRKSREGLEKVKKTTKLVTMRMMLMPNNEIIDTTTATDPLKRCSLRDSIIMSKRNNAAKYEQNYCQPYSFASTSKLSPSSSSFLLLEYDNSKEERDTEDCKAVNKDDDDGQGKKFPRHSSPPCNLHPNTNKNCVSDDDHDSGNPAATLLTKKKESTTTFDEPQEEEEEEEEDEHGKNARSQVGVGNRALVQQQQRQQNSEEQLEQWQEREQRKNIILKEPKLVPRAQLDLDSQEQAVWFVLSVLFTVVSSSCALTLFLVYLHKSYYSSGSSCGSNNCNSSSVCSTNSKSHHHCHQHSHYQQCCSDIRSNSGEQTQSVSTSLPCQHINWSVNPENCKDNCCYVDVVNGGCGIPGDPVRGILQGYHNAPAPATWSDPRRVRITQVGSSSITSKRVSLAGCQRLQRPNREEPIQKEQDQYCHHHHHQQLPQQQQQQQKSQKKSFSSFPTLPSGGGSGGGATVAAPLLKKASVGGKDKKRKCNYVLEEATANGSRVNSRSVSTCFPRRACYCCCCSCSGKTCGDIYNIDDPNNDDHADVREDNSCGKGVVEQLKNNRNDDDQFYGDYNKWKSGSGTTGHSSGVVVDYCYDGSSGWQGDSTKNPVGDGLLTFAKRNISKETTLCTCYLCCGATSSGRSHHEHDKTTTEDEQRKQECQQQQPCSHEEEQRATTHYYNGHHYRHVDSSVTLVDRGKDSSFSLSSPSLLSPSSVNCPNPHYYYHYYSRHPHNQFATQQRRTQQQQQQESPEHQDYKYFLNKFCHPDKVLFPIFWTALVVDFNFPNCSPLQHALLLGVAIKLINLYHHYCYFARFWGGAEQEPQLNDEQTDQSERDKEKCEFFNGKHYQHHQQQQNLFDDSTHDEHEKRTKEGDKKEREQVERKRSSGVVSTWDCSHYHHHHHHQLPPTSNFSPHFPLEKERYRPSPQPLTGTPDSCENSLEQQRQEAKLKEADEFTGKLSPPSAASSLSSSSRVKRLCEQYLHLLLLFTPQKHNLLGCSSKITISLWLYFILIRRLGSLLLFSTSSTYFPTAASSQLSVCLTHLLGIVGLLFGQLCVQRLGCHLNWNYNPSFWGNNEWSASTTRRSEENKGESQPIIIRGNSNVPSGNISLSSHSSCYYHCCCCCCFCASFSKTNKGGGCTRLTPPPPCPPPLVGASSNNSGRGATDENEDRRGERKCTCNFHLAPSFSSSSSSLSSSSSSFIVVPPSSSTPPSLLLPSSRAHHQRQQQQENHLAPHFCLNENFNLTVGQSEAFSPETKERRTVSSSVSSSSSAAAKSSTSLVLREESGEVKDEHCSCSSSFSSKKTNNKVNARNKSIRNDFEYSDERIDDNDNNLSSKKVGCRCCYYCCRYNKGTLIIGERSISPPTAAYRRTTKENYNFRSTTIKETKGERRGFSCCSRIPTAPLQPTCFCTNNGSRTCSNHLSPFHHHHHENTNTSSLLHQSKRITQSCCCESIVSSSSFKREGSSSKRIAFLLHNDNQNEEETRGSFRSSGKANNKRNSPRQNNPCSVGGSSGLIEGIGGNTKTKKCLQFEKDDKEEKTKGANKSGNKNPGSLSLSSSLLCADAINCSDRRATTSGGISGSRLFTRGKQGRKVDGSEVGLAATTALVSGSFRRKVNGISGTALAAVVAAASTSNSSDDDDEDDDDGSSESTQLGSISRSSSSGSLVLVSEEFPEDFQNKVEGTLRTTGEQEQQTRVVETNDDNNNNNHNHNSNDDDNAGNCGTSSSSASCDASVSRGEEEEEIGKPEVIPASSLPSSSSQSSTTSSTSSSPNPSTSAELESSSNTANNPVEAGQGEGGAGIFHQSNCLNNGRNATVVTAVDDEDLSYFLYYNHVNNNNSNSGRSGAARSDSGATLVSSGASRKDDGGSRRSDRLSVRTGGLVDKKSGGNQKPKSITFRDEVDCKSSDDGGGGVSPCHIPPQPLSATSSHYPPSILSKTNHMNCKRISKKSAGSGGSGSSSSSSKIVNNEVVTTATTIIAAAGSRKASVGSSSSSTINRVPTPPPSLTSPHTSILAGLGGGVPRERKTYISHKYITTSGVIGSGGGGTSSCSTSNITIGDIPSSSSSSCNPVEGNNDVVNVTDPMDNPPVEVSSQSEPLSASNTTTATITILPKSDTTSTSLTPSSSSVSATVTGNTVIIDGGGGDNISTADDGDNNSTNTTPPSSQLPPSSSSSLQVIPTASLTASTSSSQPQQHTTSSSSTTTTTTNNTNSVSSTSKRLFRSGSQCCVNSSTSSSPILHFQQSSTPPQQLLSNHHSQQQTTPQHSNNQQGSIEKYLSSKMRRTSLPAALPAQRTAIHHGSTGVDTALLYEAHGLVTEMLLDQAALPANIVAGLKALATLLKPTPTSTIHYSSPRPKPVPLTLSIDPDYTSDFDEIPYTGEKISTLPKGKKGVSANILRRMSTSTWTTTTSATGMPTLEPQPNTRRRRSASFRSSALGVSHRRFSQNELSSTASQLLEHGQRKTVCSLHPLSPSDLTHLSALAASTGFPPSGGNAIKSASASVSAAGSNRSSPASTPIPSPIPSPVPSRDPSPCNHHRSGGSRQRDSLTTQQDLLGGSAEYIGPTSSSSSNNGNGSGSCLLFQQRSSPSQSTGNLLSLNNNSKDSSTPSSSITVLGGPGLMIGGNGGLIEGDSLGLLSGKNPDEDNCSTTSTLGDGPGPPDNSSGNSNSLRLSPVTFTLQEPPDINEPYYSADDEGREDVIVTSDGIRFDLQGIAVDPLLCRLHEWDYPIFDLQESSKTQILSHMCYKVFLETGLFETFRIPIQEFITYFHALELGYRDKPYHNRMHAGDVLHGVYYLTSQAIPGFQMVPADPETPSASDISGQRAWFNVEEASYGIMGANFTSLELMALYVAAAMHDYDHPGRTNAFLVSTHAREAILYNDRSVLENHHAAAAWSLLLSSDDCNFLKYLDKAEFKRFRYLVIEAILATDLKRHFEIVAEFNSKVNEEDSPGIDWTQEDDRLLVMEIAIKLADINGPCKVHDIHVQWTYRIAEEFYEQGDEEAELGLPISPFMDREHPQLARLQESFINHLVAPLCKACAEAGILPGYWIEDQDEHDDRDNGDNGGGGGGTHIGGDDGPEQDVTTADDLSIATTSCQETDNEENDESSYSDDNPTNFCSRVSAGFVGGGSTCRRRIFCLQTKHLQDNHRHWMGVIKEESKKKEEAVTTVKTESVAISTEDPMETIEEENNTPHSLNRSFSFEKEDSKL